MRSEFYAVFPSVLQRLIQKIDLWRTDADMLEKLFESLSYMFKYLQKHLVADLKNVFDYYVQFFNNPKQYVREFASESFSFLLRKLSDEQVREHVAHFCSWLDRDEIDVENLESGLALLFFHSVRGTAGNLNSSLNIMLQSFCEEMCEIVCASPDQALRRFRVNLTMMQKMRKHLNNAESEEVWALLQAALERSLAASNQVLLPDKAMQSQLVTRLMSEWTRNRFHSTKTRPESLIMTCNMMQRAISALGKSMEICTATPRSFAALLELLSILYKTLNHMERRCTSPQRPLLVLASSNFPAFRFSSCQVRSC
jgi:hypothetical protein